MGIASANRIARGVSNQAPCNSLNTIMKTKLNLFFTLAGLLATGALSSCTTNVTPAAATTTSGSATTTTTTQSAYPYSGSTTTEKRTTTTQY